MSAHEMGQRIFVTIGFLLGIIALSQGVPNNVCRTFQDYYKMENNPNCYYNNVVGKLVPEIIMQSGLPFEEHKVTTRDGYILTLHRIPNTNHPSKQKTVIFLQHGLITSSSNFVVLLNDSLAFMLALNGYDVWMGNYRGNFYSDEHVNMTAFDFLYWDYNIDTIGTQDLPAMLQYVNKITGANGELIYVGHSLGGTAALMFTSEMPVQAKSLVKLIIMMAPAHLLANMKAPIRALRPFSDAIYSFIITSDMIRLVSHGKVTLPLNRLLCMESPKLLERCAKSMNLIYGPSDDMQADVWPVYFDHHPTGTSLNVIKQFVGFKNHFTKFDYGSNNIFIYNTRKAPEYNLNNINIPIHIMTSRDDWVTTMADAYNLYKALPTKAKYGIYQMPHSKFNHVSYLFGQNTTRLTNDYIISFIYKFNKRVR